MKEQIDEILAHYLNKEPLTREEMQILEAWKATSSQNEKIGEVVAKLKRQKKTLNKHQKEDAVFAKIQSDVLRTRRKRRFILWSSCAAGIALLVGFFSILNRIPEKEIALNQTYLSGWSLSKPSAELILPNGEKRLLDAKEPTVIVSNNTGKTRTEEKTLIVEASEVKDREPEYYTMNIPLGAEYNVILPDGSKVYLNAGTSLRYPDQFIGEKREVFLNGEAYFEVSSDSIHPFIVHTADVSVRVLGTAFNVNAYPEREWIKTTLVEGRVETRCGDNHFIMNPGTQVAYNKETRKAAYFPVNTQQFTSWKEGYYDFEDMPLEELMQIFTRWYNVQIEFADEELKEMKFSGRLKRYDNLKPLFEMLEYTQDLKFIMRDERTIMIRKK